MERGAMGALTVEPIRGMLPTWVGYGDGNGDGDGYGYGYGYGDGYGNGDGDGDGYGYGYGYGNGYGYGYGYGDGYGNGNGDGYGYGNGDGNGDYWRATVSNFSAKWTPEQRARLGALREQDATIAFWRSTAGGFSANGGGRIEAAAPGVVHTAPGPLSLCCSGTLHATLMPPKWKGERVWIVALTGAVVGDDEKLGALSREIIGEAL
jgi:hypothetical protein